MFRVFFLRTFFPSGFVCLIVRGIPVYVFGLPRHSRYLFLSSRVLCFLFFFIPWFFFQSISGPLFLQATIRQTHSMKKHTKFLERVSLLAPVAPLLVRYCSGPWRLRVAVTKGAGVPRSAMFRFFFFAKKVVRCDFFARSTVQIGTKHEHTVRCQIFVTCKWRYCCRFWSLQGLSGVSIGSLLIVL